MPLPFQLTVDIGLSVFPPERVLCSWKWFSTTWLVVILCLPFIRDGQDFPLERAPHQVSLHVHNNVYGRRHLYYEQHIHIMN